MLAFRMQVHPPLINKIRNRRRKSSIKLYKYVLQPRENKRLMQKFDLSILRFHWKNKNPNHKV